MNTVKLHLLCRHTNLANPATQLPSLLPIALHKSPLYVSCSKSRNNTTRRANKTIQMADNSSPKPKLFSLEKHPVEFSRTAVLGAVSVGLAVLLMTCDDGHKALALGPEGPLMEDFWDNMRRYGLYALTVSTGAIYAIMEPIVELLKNPFSAILVVLIFGGGFYLVSQVVNAMVGLTDFSYDYNY